jgi:hypothetical protein
VGTQPGKLLVSARHQALAGEIRMGQLEQVALVEKTELDVTTVDELANSNDMGSGPKLEVADQELG